MPSNVFANTGTNVSVIFLNNDKEDDQVQLIDASKLGQKVKENGLQKTVLSKDDIKKIVDTAINREDIDDFSIGVSLDEIKDKNYSFSAGQYFPVKIEYVKLTQEEFEKKMQGYQENLSELFDKGGKLGKDIEEFIGNIKYESKN